MDLNELGRMLNEMYLNSPDKEKVVMIHLFGIKYADDILGSDFSCKDLADAAGISESYRTEISKGVKLAKYVQIR